MRLPALTVEELAPDQREVLERIRNSPRGAAGRDIGLVGPFGVWVRAPRVGDATQALGTAVRFGTTLPDNVKEVAICTVGEHYRAKFEFAAHRAFAVAAGVDDAALERLRVGEAPGFAGAEDVAYRVARALVREHRLDDALYAEAHATFGEEGLIELVTTVGYYGMVSLTLNAFEVPLEPGMADPFP